MTLGECINNYINEHDLSMRKFSALAGVSHAYISNIVNGKTSRGNNPVPSIAVYRGVAKAMGMDVNTLISLVDDEIAWGEQKNPATKSDGNAEDLFLKERHEYVNSLFDKVSSEDQDYVISLLRRLSQSQQDQDGQIKSD